MKHHHLLEVFTGAVFGIAGFASIDSAITDIAMKLLLVAASGFIGGAFGLIGKVAIKCVLNRIKK